MGTNMILEMGNKFAMLFVFAYVITRIKGFRRILGRPALTLKDKLMLSIIFGIFGIIGTYFSVEFYDALLNTRIIGVAAGGLLGGPVVGLLSGIIAGIHRGLMPAGTVTQFACAVSPPLEGLMAGFVGIWIRDKDNKWIYAALTGVAGELMRKVSVLIFVKPFSLALHTVRYITLPMVLINGVGLALLFMIMENLLRDEELEIARTAELALDIADRAVVYLKNGIHSSEIQKIADLIYEMSEYTAVTITDQKRILAHVGADTNRHKVGNPILTRLTEDILRTGEMRLYRSCPEPTCSERTRCPLKSVIIFPLIEEGQVIGTVKMYKGYHQDMTKIDEKFGEGLAKLFETMLTMNKLQKLSEHVKEAELKALQAQINPHFLFNSLTVISSLCRTDPPRARDLVYHLSTYFRQNLNGTRDMVSVNTEINHVKAYVEIERARLGNKLEVEYDVDESATLELPPLLLQPIVENAIKHGIYPKNSTGHVRVQVKNEPEGTYISISDDGVGMNDETRNRIQKKSNSGSIGLSNVMERLKGHFGERCTFKISSAINIGTEIEIFIKNRAEVEGGVA
jgi:two-component system sensor histidine kinase LytS